MRIVADTNTVVSGLIWQGAPRQLINAARAGKIQLVTSPALLAELARVLGRSKFRVPIQRAGLSSDSLLADYAVLVVNVSPLSTPRVVPNDPDDDHVVACALAAGADAIVSGDHHLLDLGDPKFRSSLPRMQVFERLCAERSAVLLGCRLSFQKVV